MDTGCIYVLHTLSEDDTAWYEVCLLCGIRLVTYKPAKGLFL